MLKRRFSFLRRRGLAACLAVLLLIPYAAHADVLAEPRDDFYSRHRDDCQYLGREFYINGESGFISLKAAPNSSREVTAMKNGETFFIQFTYDHNGTAWGVGEFSDENYAWQSGWIPMSQLLPVYDYIAFQEEHEEEFHPYTGDYEKVKAAEEIVLWTWPGSGVTWGSMLQEYFDWEEFSFARSYTDEQGREWGFIGYWRGPRNAWICTDAPEDGAIEAFFPAPQPDLYPPAEPVPAPTGPPVPLLLLVMAAVLAAGTAIMIRVVYRPKKNRGDS